MTRKLARMTLGLAQDDTARPGREALVAESKGRE